MSAPHTAPVPAPQATPNANSPRGEVVLVTGMSGGGKSIAMHALEDAGFFCVDNLPAKLILPFAELTVQGGERIDRVAIVADMLSDTFTRAITDDDTSAAGQTIAEMIALLALWAVYGYRALSHAGLARRPVEGGPGGGAEL